MAEPTDMENVTSGHALDFCPGTSDAVSKLNSNNSIVIVGDDEILAESTPELQSALLENSLGDIRCSYTFGAEVSGVSNLEILVRDSVFNYQFSFEELVAADGQLSLVWPR